MLKRFSFWDDFYRRPVIVLRHSCFIVLFNMMERQCDKSVPVNHLHCSRYKDKLFILSLSTLIRPKKTWLLLLPRKLERVYGGKLTVKCFNKYVS